MLKCLRMKNWGIRNSVKAMCLTAFSFVFCFILLLNVMVHQLAVSSESSNVETKEYSVNQKKLRQLMEPEVQNSEDSYIESNRLAWPDRKPKATNEKVLNEGQKMAKDPKEKSEFRPKHFNAVKKLQSLNVQDESILDKNTDKMSLTQNNEEEKDYVYEKDINKVVIEEEEDDDDDDDDYDYDSDNVENLKTKHKQPVSSDVVTDNCIKTKNNSRDGNMVYGPSVKSNPVEKKAESLVVDGIYWSKKAEALVPKGMTKDEVTKWIRTVRNGKIKNLQPPSWDRCGRPKNGFIVMKDGTELCARYRHPHDKLVLGEVLSFYLSLLLKMDNVPAVLLSEVNNASSQWQGTDPSELDWEQHQYVALIQWIDHIDHHTESHVQIPSTLFEMYKTGNSLDCYLLNKQNLQSEEISSIIQWGSMIIFDYLTGNYDRVASMQDGAEEQNSQSVIQDFIRNLRKSTKTGKFWLIDNESGLLDGYELMYRSYDYGERFVRFHKQMLQTLCIFQHSIVEALKNLHNSINPHELLEEFTRKYEPLYDKVPKDQTQSLFHLMFSKRLSDVIEWIQHCESHVKR